MEPGTACSHSHVPAPRFPWPCRTWTTQVERPCSSRRSMEMRDDGATIHLPPWPDSLASRRVRAGAGRVRDPPRRAPRSVGRRWRLVDEDAAVALARDRCAHPRELLRAFAAVPLIPAWRKDGLASPCGERDQLRRGLARPRLDQPPERHLRRAPDACAGEVEDLALERPGGNALPPAYRAPGVCGRTRAGIIAAPRWKRHLDG